MIDIHTVLFDLDGTLADTAPDLGFALNELLREHNRPPLPYDRIRPVASYGARALLRLGFGIAPHDTGYDVLRRRFLDLYAANLCRETRLFPGVSELLSALPGRRLNWGIVTNKPAFLTEPLVRALGLADTAACVVSGDTTANSKPHPAPLLYACAQCGSAPASCLFVGDAARDIEAGRSAGMHTLVAMFGYIGEADDPPSWGADALVYSPGNVLEWIDARR
ncbi:MAG: HAD family hydrolase [Acidiferrobacterales bacterium]